MPHSTPKVSVIVPVYKVERYLSQCLDSIVGQTLDDIEIICVNDGSPDGSMDILKAYASKDTRIVIVDQINQGLSVARNNAMKIARGDYISFVDSDDWLERDALEFLTKKADEHHLDMLSFGSFLADDLTGEKSCFEYTDYSMFIPELESIIFNFNDFLNNFGAVWRFPVMAWSTLWKRAFIERHGIRFPAGLVFEDIPFFRMALLKAERMSVTNHIFYNYRQRKDSITSHRPRHCESMCKICILQYRFMAKLGTQEFLDSFVMDEAVKQMNSLYFDLDESSRKNAYEAMAKAYRTIFRKINFEELKTHDLYEDIMFLFSYQTISSIKFNLMLCRIMSKLNIRSIREKYQDKQATIEKYVEKFRLEEDINTDPVQKDL